MSDQILNKTSFSRLLRQLASVLPPRTAPRSIHSSRPQAGIDSGATKEMTHQGAEHFRCSHQTLIYLITTD